MRHLRQTIVNALLSVVVDAVVGAECGRPSPERPSPPYIYLHRDRADILAPTTFPKDIWAQIWSKNPNERLNREVLRCTDSVGIFPNREPIIHLVGAVLAEQTEQWAEGRRYLGLDILAR